MAANFLLSLFFLGVFGFWSVDCNDGTSGHCGSNSSAIQVLENGPCDLNLSLELSEGERQMSSSALCPQGDVIDCSPTKKNSEQSSLQDYVGPRFAIEIKTGRKNTRAAMGITDAVLAYLQSRWMTKFIPSVYTFVLLLSLPLNLMAICIFLFKFQAKTPSVVFMLNLAVADVLFVIMLPFNIVYRFSGNNWVMGEGMCRVVTSGFYCNMYSSILLMSAISVDRFLAVVHPVWSLSWRTVSRAWLTCLIIWVVSFSGSVPLFVKNLTVHIDQLNITTCYDMLDVKAVQSFYLPYFGVFVSLFFFLPLVITVFCYVIIIRSLSLPTIQSPFKKSRSVILCVTVLCEFIICFGPANVLFLIRFLNIKGQLADSMYFAYTLSVCLGSLSSCFDPMIYYFGSSKCKKHVYGLFCCDKMIVSYRQAEGSSKTTGGESTPCTL